MSTKRRITPPGERQLAVISEKEDVVIIVSERCIKCTNRKLGVLKTYPLDPEEDVLFYQKDGYPEIRRVRVSCDCLK